jgi:hypothetical protein
MEDKITLEEFIKEVSRTSGTKMDEPTERKWIYAFILEDIARNIKYGNKLPS